MAHIDVSSCRFSDNGKDFGEDLLWNFAFCETVFEFRRFGL
jgi:hypothetical protein